MGEITPQICGEQLVDLDRGQKVMDCEPLGTL